MKWMKVVALLIFVNYLIILKVHGRGVVPLAINSILGKYFLNKTKTIDIINCGAKNGLSANVVDKLVKLLPKDFVIQVKSDIQFESIKLNTFSILAFDSVKNFLKFTTDIEWQTNPTRRYKHLVYIGNAKADDLKNAIHDGYAVDNVGFLVQETPLSIDLVTCYMNTPTTCRKKKFETINRFNRSTMSWDNSTFYPEKYKNFYGCNITASFIDYNFPFYYMFLFANHNNAKLRFTNVTSSACDNMQDLHAELMYDGNLDEGSCGVSSYPIKYDMLVFFTPPGHPYTPLEKMFLPFEYEVWISILTTFSIGFVSIQILKRCPIKIRNFVFGRNINTPTVNMISIFLTGAQFKIPGRNFARFLLCLFVIWSMIIRTCYQSKLFESLQSEDRKPGPKNFAELINQNFTLYMTSLTNYDIVSEYATEKGLNLKLIEYKFPKSDVINLEDPMTWNVFSTVEFDKRMITSGARNSFLKLTSSFDFERLVEPKFKGATLQLRSVYDAINDLYHEGVSSFKVLDEHVRYTSAGIRFNPSSPYYERYNDFIMRISESGLDQYWEKRGKKKPITIGKRGPQVLTMEQLEMAFIFCIVPIGISLLIFFIEYAFDFVKRHFKIFVNKLVIYFVIKNLYALSNIRKGN